MNTYTPDELNRLYNNRLLVPECMDILAKWTQESAAVRQTQRCHIDVPYGKADSHKLDIFPSTNHQAPVVFKDVPLNGKLDNWSLTVNQSMWWIIKPVIRTKPFPRSRGHLISYRWAAITGDRPYFIKSWSIIMSRRDGK